MADNFATYDPGLSGPAGNAAAVTPNDGADLATTARSLWVGVTGDVKVDCAISGTAIVFKAVPVGWLQVRARRVYTTGTTATNMVAVW